MKKIQMVLFLFLAAVLYANDNNQRSITFAQAAELAISTSIELREAHASQSIKEGVWKLGLREYFPHFGLNVSENDRLQEIGSDSFIKNYGITLDQLIWDGGRISMTRKLEKMELDLSSSRLDMMATDVAEAAITAYRNILSSRSILEIRKTALSVLEEQRRILNEEVALGLALSVDLANADINLAEARIDIYSLQLDLNEMENQFAELLGLEYMPILVETVDINRSILLPAASAAGALARERNPDVIEARFSLTKRQAELKYVNRSWIPTLKLVANFGLSGQRYPLTRYNWSIGISIDFSNPWLQNRFSAQAGGEPPYDKTAAIQNSLNPLPDPASSFGKRQATLALQFEQERFDTILERTGRMAANAVEKCRLVEQKRILALDASRLAAERCRIEEIRLELGQITRLKLMETLIEQTQREIAVIEAAVAILEAERELERFLDLKPGELAVFAASLGGI